MNYLAHLFLAENHAASRVGNLMGDFVTGTPDSLRPRFPGPVLAGIVRHRTLDAWTDQHPAIHALKACIAPQRRRFAGAIIDVTFDYFLTLQWDRFSPLSRRDFLDQCYAALLEYRHFLPPGLFEGLDERIENDWLGHYGSEKGLCDVFLRMSRRRPAFAILETAVEDFTRHQPEFAAGFSSFFPAAIAQVKSLGPELSAL